MSTQADSRLETNYKRTNEQTAGGIRWQNIRANNAASPATSRQLPLVEPLLGDLLLPSAVIGSSGLSPSTPDRRARRVVILSRLDLSYTRSPITDFTLHLLHSFFVVRATVAHCLSRTVETSKLSPALYDLSSAADPLAFKLSPRACLRRNNVYNYWVCESGLRRIATSSMASKGEYRRLILLIVLGLSSQEASQPVVPSQSLTVSRPSRSGE